MAEYSAHNNEAPPNYPVTDLYPNLHNNLADSFDSDISLTVSDVVQQKAQAKKKFDLLREKLQQKEDFIMALIESNDNAGEQEKIEQLRKLRDSKASLKESMDASNEDPDLKQASDNIQNRIEKLEKQLNISNYFEWKLTECERAIENVCVLVKHGNLLNYYRRKKRLLWQGVTNGSERTQVLNPSGMAVHPSSDYIFVGDPGNHRIQTYNSEGKHLYSTRLEKDFNIVYLEFLEESLILLGTVRRAFYLAIMADDKVIRVALPNFNHIKFNEKDIPDPNIVFSLDRSTLSIQVCIYLPNHIILTQAFSIETCEPIKNHNVNMIHLKSPRIEDSTKALRLKAVGEFDDMQFHVLYQNSPFVLQTFNLKGDLTRAIISSNLISLSPLLSRFLLDKDGNIIICTVRQVTKLNKKTESIEIVDIVYSFYVFSDSGTLQYKWKYTSSKSPTNLVSIPQRFRKYQHSFSEASSNENQDSHQLFANINSNQDIVVMYSAEPSFLLRAF